MKKHCIPFLLRVYLDYELTGETHMVNRYQVQIAHMIESSGNNQFFVYAVDTLKDNSSIFNCNKLNFSCHQSKHYDFSNKEPLERAAYDATQLLKFFNLKRSDLQVSNSKLTKEELLIIQETFDFWHYDV